MAGEKWYKYAGVGTQDTQKTVLLAGLLAIFLWVIDFIYGFNGFEWTSLTELGLRFWMAVPINILLFINIIWYIVRPGDQRVILSRFMFIWIILDFITLKGFRGTGIFHLFIPLLIYVFWIRQINEEESSANFTLAGLILVDFVFYGALQHYVGGTNDALIKLLSNRLIFPVWGWYVLLTSAGKTQSSGSKLVLAILMGLVIFNVIDNTVAIGANMDLLPPSARQGAWEFLISGYNNAKDSFKKMFTDFGKYKDSQLEYATGGYYTSEVEENVEEPLGVYIENVQSAQERYFQGEPVVIWADLKAKTLNEPIGITMNCTIGEGADVKIGEFKPDYYPKAAINFNVTAEEEESLQCKFDSLTPATHAIKIDALFNFETMAYLKTYFMDIERIRALKRNNIDPLDQYGITDKSPTARYTNGPVRIGIGTNEQLPIGLGEDYIQSPRLGITIENQWNGKIKNITNLVIQIPESMKLEETKEDGITTICNGWFEEVEDAEINEELKDEGYRSYAITKVGKETIKLPIETFESIRCLIEIDKENVKDVLGNTPIATHYYRADVEYVYAIESSVSVSVVKDPNEPFELNSCTDNCDDSRKCKCVKENCLSTGKIIEKGTNCGGPISGGTSEQIQADPFTAPPSNTQITINNGEPTTNSLAVTLTLKATNPNSCRIWNQGDAIPGIWDIYAETKQWNLKEEGNSQGQRAVWYQCRTLDENLNAVEGEKVMDQIEYIPQTAQTT